MNATAQARLVTNVDSNMTAGWRARRDSGQPRSTVSASIMSATRLRGDRSGRVLRESDLIRRGWSFLTRLQIAGQQADGVIWM